MEDEGNGVQHIHPTLILILTNVSHPRHTGIRSNIFLCAPAAASIPQEFRRIRPEKKEERPRFVMVATSMHFKLKRLASFTWKQARKVRGEVRNPVLAAQPADTIRWSKRIVPRLPEFHPRQTL